MNEPETPEPDRTEPDQIEPVQRRTWLLLGPDGPYRSPVPGKLGGYRAGKIYGRLDCSAALGAIRRGGYVTNRVFFADAATATATGYRPCGRCLRANYLAWRATTTT